LKKHAEKTGAKNMTGRLKFIIRSALLILPIVRISVMKVPSGLISKITPEYRQFTMQTFDWSLLIFQVILVLLPFALVGIFIVEPDTFTSIAVFLGGLSLIGYWIARNFLGRYTILLADTYVE